MPKKKIEKTEVIMLEADEEKEEVSVEIEYNPNKTKKPRSPEWTHAQAAFIAKRKGG